MAKKETAKDKKVKELLLQLGNKDEKVQLQAVKSLKIHGNETAIEPLVFLLSHTQSGAIEAEILDLLNTIKSTAVPKEIIKCLNNDAYVKSSQHLLASIWSSGLDYRPYFADIASATIKGDFMHAMECITILENFDEALTEEQIMDSLLIFKGYLVDAKGEDSSKVELIKEIVLTLQSMNDSI